MKLRIYPEHIHEYHDFLNSLSEKMKKDIKKASVCKRLLNPDDCNPRCVMGYTFKMDGEQYQKYLCIAIMPTFSAENNPYISCFCKINLHVDKHKKEENADKIAECKFICQNGAKETVSKFL